VSEALTVLPAFTPAAIPGLFAGCLLANLLNPAPTVWDIVLGSLATLAAAFWSWKWRARKWLVPLPPVLVNAAVVGPMLYLAYGMALFPAVGAWNALIDAGAVAAGELVACYGLGMPLYFAVDRIWKRI
jgi:uncharacterized membrane protein